MIDERTSLQDRFRLQLTCNNVSRIQRVVII